MACSVPWVIWRACESCTATWNPRTCCCKQVRARRCGIWEIGGVYRVYHLAFSETWRGICCQRVLPQFFSNWQCFLGTNDGNNWIYKRQKTMFMDSKNWGHPHTITVPIWRQTRAIVSLDIYKFRVPLVPKMAQLPWNWPHLLQLEVAVLFSATLA
jgi:hypothetical protein